MMIAEEALIRRTNQDATIQDHCVQTLFDQTGRERSDSRSGWQSRLANIDPHLFVRKHHQQKWGSVLLP